MPTLRAALAGLCVAVVVALGTAGPAAALEPTAEAAPAASTRQVLGQPWSAPAFPVDCTAVDKQISCTPADPTEVKAQQCFTGVYFAGAASTLCTTFEGHVTAIQASGGKPLLVEYGCSLGDVVCVTFENAGRGLALSATAMMAVVADVTRFDTSTVLWTAAVDEWSFWQWAVLIVLFTAFVWAIGAAVVSGDREQLVGAVLRCFVAIPAVPLTLWVTGKLLNAVDQMTWYIIGHDGPGSIFPTLQSVMWAGGQANYFFAFVIHGMLMIAMLLLTLVFAFRNIVLAALIMVGPIAWMIFPLRGIGPQWVVRYLSSVVVLLLTGPLTIGFVSLIVHGLANVKTIWDPQSWPLLFGLVLVAFAPFAVFGLFSFVGAVAADSVGSRVGAHAGRMTGGAARTATRVPARVGATAAGVPAGSRGPAAARGAAAGRTGRSGGAPTGAARPAGHTASQGSKSAGSVSTSSYSQKPSPPSSTAKPAPGGSKP